jgi:Family of unknown function (DUF5996)
MGDTRLPRLPLEAWEPTKNTLHLWAQIIGKTRLALVPMRNHWWNATLYPSARGLTTSAARSLTSHGDPEGSSECDLGREPRDDPVVESRRPKICDHHPAVTTSATSLGSRNSAGTAGPHA